MWSPSKTPMCATAGRARSIFACGAAEIASDRAPPGRDQTGAGTLARLRAIGLLAAAVASALAFRTLQAREAAMARTRNSNGSHESHGSSGRTMVCEPDRPPGGATHRL